MGITSTVLSCVTSWVRSQTELQKEELFYGTLWCSIAHMWTSSFPQLWLAYDLWVDILVYKYQLQFNTCTGFVLGPGSLVHDALQLAMFPNTWIRLGVSWLQWQSIKATWHGFQKASIYVSHAKTSFPWTSEGHPPRLYLSSEKLGLLPSARCTPF